MQRKNIRKIGLEKGSFGPIKPFSSNLFAFSIIVSLYRGRLCQAQSIQQLIKMLKTCILKIVMLKYVYIIFFCLWKGAKIENH